MFTLHHCISARSFRPLWGLEKLGLSYKLVVLPYPPQVKRPSFLQLNPLGTVPLLAHGNVQLTESAAMCEYLCTLARPTPLAVGPNEEGFGAYRNFLHFGEATLTCPLALLLRYSQFEPVERRNEAVAGDHARWFLAARLHTLEARYPKVSPLRPHPNIEPGRFLFSLITSQSHRLT